MLTRQTYKDVDYPIVDVPIGFTSDFFQPKYDGIWALVTWTGNPNEPATIHSRTGELKGTLSVPNIVQRFGPFVLVGEYLVSQQRAVDSPDYGKIRFFDCVELNYKQLATHPYKARYGALYALLYSQVNATTKWLLTPNYHLQHLPKVWEEQVSTGKLEGIVYRSWDSSYDTPLWRSKACFTVDLILIALARGEGKYSDTLGALVLGYCNSDVIITCSGMSDSERHQIWKAGNSNLGRIVEVLCSGVFNSGSLRHPRFLRFRDDKKASECLKPQI